MATPDLRSDWRQVSEDATKLHTDVKTAVGDTRDVAADKARHAAGYAAGYARDRAQDATEYARNRAHDAAGYVHDQTRAAPQHVKDAVGGTAERAGGVVDNIKGYLFGGGKKPETAQEQVKQGWFGVKSSVGQAAESVKETGEAIKNQALGTPKPENHWFGFTEKQSIDKPGGDEQFWFHLYRVEPKDPFARLYDDAVAVKDAATRRRADIEEALARVPEDARDAAHQVRDSVADWAEKAKEKTKETLEEGWMNWDEATSGMRKEVEELAEGIWRSAEDKTHKVTKKIKDVTKVAHKNLTNAYSALENRYAEMDRKMHDEFDTLVAEAGDLKDNYEELRDETIALARYRRDQALSTARQSWEKGVDEAREKLEQLEKLASKYQPNSENRRAVQRQLREAYDAARGSLDSTVAEARSKLEEAETCVGKTWDEAAGQVRSARESVKEKAHSAWDEARAAIPNPTKVIEGAAHEARDSREVQGRATGDWGDWAGAGKVRRGCARGAAGDVVRCHFCAVVRMVGKKSVDREEEVTGLGWRRDATDGKNFVWAADRRREYIEGRQSRWTTPSLTPSTTPTRTTFPYTQTHQYALYTQLSHAVHDLGVFTATAPFLALILLMMELNGYDHRFLHALYITLIASRLLQTEQGVRLATEIGASRHLGAYLLWGVASVSATLCAWGWIITLGGLPGLPVRVVRE
ncbi:hypothetical protein BC937DRAFT_95617 [Endogone sp. FLAS-F59071]|nr:hypothetical protein BC937DRAFT_95617 [Endogone sp. FLAS-F59071]|eukprot:RUS20243.1 hypothetical protein BC937DRAFT_95617 [Endogone sp. FLAS-F59071]